MYLGRSAFSPDSAFHAYRSSSPQSMFPVLPVSYDSVRCSTLDGTTGQDLLNCDTTPSSGRCDSTRDAAAVACEPLPMAKVPGNCSMCYIKIMLVENCYLM